MALIRNEFRLRKRKKPKKTNQIFRFASLVSQPLNSERFEY